MKILIIQEKGRHQKNWNFRESLCIKRAFDKLGVESIVWGLNYDNFVIPFEEIEKDCDIIFLVENYPYNQWLPNLEKSKKLKIFWSIDSHVVLKQHIEMCEKHKIDIVLNSVYGHQNLFTNQETHFFPNAYCDDLIKPLSIDKTIDIGFCGNINNRGGWLNEIGKKFNLKINEFIIGNEMVESINKFKIHFNRNISYDINYRTFETLGCKTFLLTNFTPGLDKIFEINKHLVIYENLNDLFEKIEYYLSNEIERSIIAKNGYKHVLENHTYSKRMEEFINIVNKKF
jgi:hypothetical protein